MSTHSTQVGTTKITIKADFANAASPIFVRYSDCGEDAEFEPTGMQVADFQHSYESALSHFATQAA